jgi:hypothetical protein
MANFIEASNIDSKRFVTFTSRYSGSDVYYYTENKLLTFGTYKKTNIPLSNRDKYYVVTSSTEFRPDLVSLAAYGTVDFWWKIMESNNIKDIYQFRSGLNIRLPDNIMG